MNYPSDLMYTKKDEWVRVEDGVGTIGVSDFAQDQLSDIVYLEINLKVGSEAKKGEIFGTVESVKAASDIYLPVSGKIIEINDALMDTPEVINHDPYGEGWMVKLKLTEDKELEELMDATTYESDTQERG
ncbi:MAG: glycine cleavage system protein GcvH [Anaerolineae bacterium]|nr:glycine cleavage system protein GcvH [Anaerolineae bacterium]